MFSTRALRIFFFAILAPFLIIIAFLFRFQILEGAKYERIAEFNFVRVQTIFPTRGEIFDRHYRPIAVNFPSTNLYLLPAKIHNLSNVASFVSSHLPIEEEEIRELVFRNRFRNYQEIVLYQNLDHEKIVEIAEGINRYPSLFFRTENFRHYNIKNHFTGYVNRISRDEFELLKDSGYTPNCMIGKTGLEKQYEEYLRGKLGHRIIQVDATGRSFELFKDNLDQPAVNGSDMVLTIDSELQGYIDNIFPENYNGVVLVLDAKDGGVMAYVSRPTYDLNMFSANISADYWASIVQDRSHPLLDRVAMATYPPASLFKTVFAVVALENDIVELNEKTIYCTGRYNYGNRSYGCWLEEGHGRLNLQEAIKHSCNVYFYDLSLSIDLDLVSSFLNTNGLLGKTGIDLPSERNGFFPSTEWYFNRHNTRALIAGHKINLSIGQGEVLMTPLQVAVFYNAIANNGTIIKPHFLSQVLGLTDDIEDSGTSLIKNRLNLSDETIKIVQESLFRAVNEPGGTGLGARVPGARVHGKTGTAENHQGKNPHAWFAGYVEWESEPEITVVVMVENYPGTGGRTAAPLAGRIIRHYQENIRNRHIERLSHNGN